MAGDFQLEMISKDFATRRSRCIQTTYACFSERSGFKAVLCVHILLESGPANLCFLFFAFILFFLFFSFLFLSSFFLFFKLLEPAFLLFLSFPPSFASRSTCSSYLALSLTRSQIYSPPLRGWERSGWEISADLCDDEREDTERSFCSLLKRRKRITNNE